MAGVKVVRAPDDGLGKAGGRAEGPSGVDGALTPRGIGRVGRTQGAELGQRDEQIADALRVDIGIRVGDRHAASEQGIGLTDGQAGDGGPPRGQRIPGGLVRGAVGRGLRRSDGPARPGDVRRRVGRRGRGRRRGAAPHAAAGAEGVEHRLAGERVGERGPTGRWFGDHRGGDGLVERIELVATGHGFNELQRERAAGDGADAEGGVGLGRQLAQRLATTSRTLVGTASAPAPDSATWRTTSPTKNGLPAVSAWMAAVSSAPAASNSPPLASATSASTHSGSRPDSGTTVVPK